MFVPAARPGKLQTSPLPAVSGRDLMRNTGRAAIATGTAGQGAMEDIRSIVARFPGREFEIRRRCARDAHFRTICSDYEEAADALRRLRGVAGESSRKVEEYVSFLAELETEILEHLQGNAPGARRSQ
ncbi:hypothetical protein [Microbaculum marinum]|uniref:Uncharacterized protein n=1 Tax=Microbaculum marinum TaxID=1764581 RepID=A0AAW9RYQ2_9HYPH